MKRWIPWAFAGALAVFPAGPVWAEVTLQVTPVQGGASLEVDFGTARSLGAEGEEESDTVIRQVRLNVTSNSGRPYQVFQRVNGPWTGPDGKEVPMSAVRFFISETRGGTNRFPSSAPLDLGEQEIFLSDPSGPADELLLTYTVKLPVGQRAGSYRTTVSYRVVAQ